MSEERWKEKAEVIELVRPYGRLALSGLLFGGAAFYFANEAWTNDRGLIINGIIHLGPAGADIFYAVFAMLSTAFVAAAARSIVGFRARKRFRVVVGKKRMAIARSYRIWERVTDDEPELRYEDLASVTLTPPTNPRHLAFVRRDGSSLMLSKIVVGNGWTLRAIADLVMKRARERADKLAEEARRPEPER